jgi:acyl-CoA synthetase (AMP-forming)/AMP-acid ligase II
MGAPLEREAALRYQRVLTPRIMNGSETGEGIMRSLKGGYGYVNNDREQAAKFRDGWLYSGDLATGDASGDGLTAAQLGKHAKAHTMLAHYKRPAATASSTNSPAWPPARKCTT